MTGARYLSRSEAEHRSASVSVRRYEVELDLRPEGTLFRSVTEVWFTADTGAEALHLDLEAAQVIKILVNGVEIDSTQAYDGYRIELPELATDNHVRVDAWCAYGVDGHGLCRVDLTDGATYVTSQFQPTETRRCFACFDQPDLKAVFVFTISTPPDWLVIGNAGIASQRPADDGSVVTQFDATPPLPPYATAVAAGRYQRVERVHPVSGRAAVPLSLVCRPDVLPRVDVEDMFDLIGRGLDYFSSLYGMPYPFPKLDYIFAPRFAVGGVENAGAVVLSEEFVPGSRATAARLEHAAMVVLHELAHMWFGNFVTMKWWDDLWLNESFATYAAIRCLADATRWRNSWTTFGVQTKAWAVREDQGPTSHPIRADVPSAQALATAFDGITYAKGTAALRQLAAFVGPSFDRVLAAYLRRHAWSVATSSDLIRQLDEATTLEVTDWADRWLGTTGLDTLRPAVTVGADAVTSVAVELRAPDGQPRGRPHVVGVGLYYTGATGDYERRRSVQLRVDGPRTEIPELTGVPVPDVVLVDDGDLTYAKVRFDAGSAEALRTTVGRIVDPATRAACWSAAWDATRDGEMAATDFVTMVLSGIDRDAHSPVGEILLRQLDTACSQYVDPARVPGQRRRVAEASRSGLLSAAAGSHPQLVWAHSLIANARDGDLLDDLRDLLRERVDVPGLAVDPELRWRILTRLAAAGTLAARDIEAAAEGDSSPLAERHAAACHAARPSIEAKESAWRLMCDPTQLPPTVVAVGQAWAQPEQADLLRPFVERYLDSIGRLWQARPVPAAKVMAQTLLPPCIDDATIATIEDFAATAEWPDQLRGVVRGRADDHRRALKCRAVDKAAYSAADSPSEGDAGRLAGHR
jgi:aminopeptidase N